MSKHFGIAGTLLLHIYKGFFFEFDELVFVLLDEFVYLAFELLLGVLVEFVELLVLLDDLIR